jgi:hypothetical protein
MEVADIADVTERGRLLGATGRRAARGAGGLA